MNNSLAVKKENVAPLVSKAKEQFMALVDDGTKLSWAAESMHAETLLRNNDYLASTWLRLV